MFIFIYCRLIVPPFYWSVHPLTNYNNSTILSTISLAPPKRQADFSCKEERCRRSGVNAAWKKWTVNWASLAPTADTPWAIPWADAVRTSARSARHSSVAPPRTTATSSPSRRTTMTMCKACGRLSEGTKCPHCGHTKCESIPDTHCQCVNCGIERSHIGPREPRNFPYKAGADYILKFPEFFNREAKLWAKKAKTETTASATP